MPTSALLIIDIQTAIVGGEGDVLAAIADMAARARAAGAPVIYLQNGEPG